MFNFDGAFFRILYDMGIDLSKVDDFTALSDCELIIISLCIMTSVFIIALFIRGLMYVFRELVKV